MPKHLLKYTGIFAALGVLCLSGAVFAASDSESSNAKSTEESALVAGYRPFQPDFAAKLAPEKRAAFDKLMLEHQQEMRALHNRLWEKRTLLDALAANPNATPDMLKTLVKEMSGLRVQQQDKHDALRARVKSDFDLDLPFMPGAPYYGMGPHNAFCNGLWKHRRHAHQHHERQDRP